MKKLCIAVLVLAVLTALLCACGDTSAVSSAPDGIEVFGFQIDPSAQPSVGQTVPGGENPPAAVSQEAPVTSAGIVIEGAECGREIALPTAPKGLPLTEEKPFAVPFSYVDLNGHMNNTRYLDLAQDILPASFRARTLCRIVTEYSGEAKEGDTLLLETASDENRFCLQGSLSQRVFRLVMEYTQA